MGSRRPFFPDGFSEIVEDIKEALFKEGQFEERQEGESGLPTFTVLCYKIDNLCSTHHTAAKLPVLFRCYRSNHCLNIHLKNINITLFLK